LQLTKHTILALDNASLRLRVARRAVLLSVQFKLVAGVWQSPNRHQLALKRTLPHIIDGKITELKNRCDLGSNPADIGPNNVISPASLAGCVRSKYANTNNCSTLTAPALLAELPACGNPPKQRCSSCWQQACAVRLMVRYTSRARCTRTSCLRHILIASRMQQPGELATVATLVNLCNSTS
jgi:hypothetical protein